MNEKIKDHVILSDFPQQQPFGQQTAEQQPFGGGVPGPQPSAFLQQQDQVDTGAGAGAAGGAGVSLAGASSADDPNNHPGKQSFLKRLLFWFDPHLVWKKVIIGGGNRQIRCPVHLASNFVRTIVERESTSGKTTDSTSCLRDSDGVKSVLSSFVC